MILHTYENLCAGHVPALEWGVELVGEPDGAAAGFDTARSIIQRLRSEVQLTMQTENFTHTAVRNRIPIRLIQDNCIIFTALLHLIGEDLHQYVVGLHTAALV